MERRVNTKVSCTVWSRGKSGDHIKALPIAIGVEFPVNKLIYTVGQLEKYSFVDGKNSLNGKDILGDFFEQIQREGFKQTKGQFFTPNNIVQFILYALELDNRAIKRLKHRNRS